MKMSKEQWEFVREAFAQAHSDGCTISGLEALDLGIEICEGVIVPREPTKAMLQAMMEAQKAWCEPHSAEYEEGCCVDNGISQDECDALNAEIGEDFRNGYTAMLAAAEQRGREG